MAYDRVISADKCPRQAVVVIHGIGEQTPMETLRGFVENLVDPSPNTQPGSQREERPLSKPDRISPTLELRRMAIPGRLDEHGQIEVISTDFYELYWAHLMTGTAWRHVAAWLRVLLLRRPDHVPSRIVAWWLAAWLLLLTTAALFVWKHPDVSTLASLGIIGAVIGLLLKSAWSLFSSSVIEVVGDAARYLSPTPANIGVRHAIRAAALDLLRGLHDDPLRRYHRIVVVGHSLGSVIAYDALTYFWQERHHPASEHVMPRAQPDHAEMKTADALQLCSGRDLQSRLWREQRAIGVSWKITDFITLGSPLAHASFLMARGPEDFNRRCKQREFPTCPPQAEDPRDFSYGESLLDVKGAGILHHAALFACTRWTNLYFPGDIVGGPLGGLCGLFGRWIEDKRLESPHCFGLGRFLPTSHTRYWRATEIPGLSALRDALALRVWWTPENTVAAMTPTPRELIAADRRRDG